MRRTTTQKNEENFGTKPSFQGPQPGKILVEGFKISKGETEKEDIVAEGQSNLLDQLADYQKKQKHRQKSPKKMKRRGTNGCSSR